MFIRRIQQISESHCGPAVLSMLLEALGVSYSQETIAEAAGAQDTIEENGMTVDQLGKASTVLAPQVQFWYKYYSSLDDIRYLLERGYAIGVEWQGLFYDDEEEEEESDEYGHYSIISHIDEELQELIIVDPYRYFAKQDRIFSVDFFLKRWWDTNEVKDPDTRQYKIVKDNQLLFFVTPKDVYFPREMGFKAFSAANAAQQPNF